MIKSCLLLFLSFTSLSCKSIKSEEVNSKKSLECNHTENSFKCVNYVKNYDADTITFNIGNVHPIIGKNISVRVKNIDTPEIKGKGKCEKEAARISKKLIEAEMKHAKNIELKNCEKDKYFRLLCEVWYDGKSIESILTKNKLSYEYHGKTKKVVDWCKAVGK